MNLTQGLHRAVQQHPDAVATICGDRVRTHHPVVVPAADASVTLDELSAFCRERIAGYKTPRSMEVVDALPLSAARKVLKRELRRPYWDGQERGVH